MTTKHQVSRLEIYVAWKPKKKVLKDFLLFLVIPTTGVSILQENLNYSPALYVICQILPQLQSYRHFLTWGIDLSFDNFFLFLFLIIWWGVTEPNVCLDMRRGECLRGMCPPQKLKNSVFFKLELCNLMNTFGCKFRAGNG